MEIREIMEEIYERHTGHGRDKLRKDMERDKFMSPEQAREYGLIDRLVAPQGAARFPGEGGA
jgi:ATP-dependent Clp protease protease subunit